MPSPLNRNNQHAGEIELGQFFALGVLSVAILGGTMQPRSCDALSIKDGGIRTKCPIASFGQVSMRPRELLRGTRLSFASPTLCIFRLSVGRQCQELVAWHCGIACVVEGHAYDGTRCRMTSAATCSSTLAARQRGNLQRRLSKSFQPRAGASLSASFVSSVRSSCGAASRPLSGDPRRWQTLALPSLPTPLRTWRPSARSGTCWVRIRSARPPDTICEDMKTCEDM